MDLRISIFQIDELPSRVIKCSLLIQHQDGASVGEALVTEYSRYLSDFVKLEKIPQRTFAF